MKIDLNMLLEMESLKNLEPSIDNFQKQIKESRLGIAGIAVIVLIGGVFIALDAEPPLIERKFWFGVAIASLATMVAVLAVCAPGGWVKKVSIGKTPDIDCVLANESKTNVSWRIHWKQHLISFAIILPIQLVGLFVTFTISVFWGLLLLVPTTLFSIARMQFLGNENATTLFELLRNRLASKGYERELNYRATQIQRSFVNQELQFKVDESWRTDFGDGRITWFRYTNSGDSVGSSGIACSAVYYEPPSLRQVADRIASLSSLYFDRKSVSLFGTFNNTGPKSSIRLENIPWQYMDGELILRLNESLLLYLESLPSGFDNQLVEQLVLSSETLFQRLDEHQDGNTSLV